MFRSLYAFVLLAALLAPSAVVAKAEKILDYQSRITINENATVIVTETIKVQTAGAKIKRGIYRDFPTTSRDSSGSRRKVGFQLLEVLRDGRGEAHHIESISNGKRIYVGKKDVFLKPGIYTYTLKYATNRQIGYFDDFDEIYWNVTGNDWAFPIEHVKAIVELPPGGYVVRQDAYTGPRGAKGRDFIAGADIAGNTTFVTTRALKTGEGLTIAVAWPKGIVYEPSSGQKLSYLIRDNTSNIIGFAGLLFILAYYLFAWDRVGRDPKGGTIVPLFTPPHGFSPAAARFVLNMGFDNKTFAAAIVSMAVKGVVKIEDTGANFIVKKTGDDISRLSPGEKAVVGELFSKDDSVVLSGGNRKQIRGAEKALKQALRREFEAIYFKTNSKYLIPGAVLSLIIAVCVVFTQSGVEGMAIAGFTSFWLTVWTAGCVGMFMVVFNGWKRVFSGNYDEIIVLIITSLFVLPFFGGEIMGVFFLVEATSITSASFILAIGFLFPLFYWLLKSPTMKGRKIMDQVEGFKMYMSVAEKDRMNMLHPPEETPELFEKYLPFALALGVEQQWGERFASVLAAAGQEGGRGYHPVWYSGSSWNTEGCTGLADSLGGGFSSALGASASVSGSGGGGSSGGGGGGGGGGGW